MYDTTVELTQSWLAIYTDPWFLQFPVTTLLISNSAFLLLALPWTLVAWLEPRSLAKYKIQNKPFEVGKYFLPSIGRLLQNNVAMALVLIIAWPVIRHSGVHTGPLPAWYVILAQLVFFVVLDDFLYYWMHRSFHVNRWLLKHVHSVHHRVRNTCGINGNYMHWIEFVATASLMLLGPILLEAHLYVVWIWVVIRQVEAVDGHSGYDIPWNPLHYLPVYEGPVYHDFHHARFKGNYAGCLPYLDRYMGGTYIAEYLVYLQAKRRGLTPHQAALELEQASAQSRSTSGNS